MANHRSFLALVILLTTYSSSSVFGWIPAAFVHHTSTRTVKYNAKTSEDIEEEYKKHRLLNDPKGKEEEELLEAEKAAAFYAHDVSDAGFEAAAMERAVMMAEELKEKTHEKEGIEQRSQGKDVQKKEKASTTSGGTDLTVEEEEELLEAEEAAAFDAHDVSDPGLEAAAMERAVMMAEELKEGASVVRKPMRKLPVTSKSVEKTENTQKNSEDTSLTAEEEELLEAEDAAALDAHDVSDAGFEAAAMERAVMMAEEFKEKAHAKQTKKK